MSNNWNGERVVHMYNNRALSVVINNDEVYQLSHTNPSFENALTAIREKDIDALRQACKPIEVVRSTEMFRTGNITVEDNAVMRNGQPIHSALADRILEFAQTGYPFEPLVAFMDRLYQNPSKIAVDELFLFLDSSVTPAPIMEDGRFLAYKKVRWNYFDIYSNTTDYSLGNIVEMPRNEVDDDRNNTCSAGLHFCSMSYLSSFGSSNYGDTRIVIVAIDPADVVSIPSDYDNAKGRAWKMEVIGELSREQYNQAIRNTHDFGGSYVDTQKTTVAFEPFARPETDAQQAGNWSIVKYNDDDDDEADNTTFFINRASQHIRVNSSDGMQYTLHPFDTRQAARDYAARDPKAHIVDNGRLPHRHKHSWRVRDILKQANGNLKDRWYVATPVVAPTQMSSNIPAAFR